MQDKIVNFWYKKSLPRFFEIFSPLEKIYAFFTNRKRKKIQLLHKAVFAEISDKQNNLQKSEWRLHQKSQTASTNSKSQWRLQGFESKSDARFAHKLLQKSFIDKNGERINLLQANRHINAKIPLIIVGNISLGGTGKTPIVASLTSLLQKQGLKVAIISRGYGGKAREFAQQVQQNSSHLEVGDEALMLFKETGADVFVDKIRARALDAAIKSGAQAIISDDGLQHFGLVAQIKILVVDANRGFGNNRLLPLGALRENPQGILPNIDFILQNTNGAYTESTNLQKTNGAYAEQTNKNTQTYNFSLKGKSWQNGLGEELSAIPFSKGAKVNALAGIGNPQRFFHDLHSMGLELVEHIYADHYKMSPKVLRTNNNFAWIMTSKDAVKLNGALGANHWVYKVEADFAKNHQEADEQKIDPQKNQEQDFIEQFLTKIHNIRT